MMTKRQIRDIRRAAEEFDRRISAGVPSDAGEYLETATLAGTLALAVPLLLDEIERLQSQRAAPQSSGFVKFSALGGRA